MSDINLSIIDGGDLNLTLSDDGTIDVSVVNDGDLNVTLDGISTFQALSDTPSSYSGQSGKVVSVNSGEDALEFTASSGSGTVTSVAAGNGLDFTTITSTGNVTMGTPSTTTASTTNAVTTTSHTHQLDESGISITASQVSDFDTEVSNNTSVASNTTHRGLTNNPHSVDASDVSLGNVTNVATDGTAYNATSWDNNSDAATKNAIRDKVETMDTAIGLNTAKDTNVSTNLSEGTSTQTTVAVNSSDGTNATLVSASTSRAGLLTKAKWDEIVANTNKTTNATHTSQVTGSGALTVDKTAISDQGTVTAVGADYVIIGDTSDAGNLKKSLISDFASAGGDMAAATYDPTTVSGDCFDMDNMVDGSTNAVMTLTQETNFGTAYTHSQDNTQAHSDYLLNSGADSAVGPLTITADNSSADTAYVPMVLYNTDATPPAASGFPVGTIYLQYTA